MKYKIFLSVGLLSLVIGFGLAYGQSGVLEGAFQKSKVTADKSKVEVSSSASESSTIDWDSSDNSEITLGKWRIKSKEDLTLKGFSFFIGDIESLSTSSDNFLTKYFSTINFKIEAGGASIVETSSTNAYLTTTEANIAANTSYTVTLSGTAKEDALADFFVAELNSKEVAMMIYNITTSDGDLHIYVEEEFPALIKNEEQNADGIEYTFGGYTLSSDTQIALNPDSDDLITPSKTEIEIEQSYTKSNGNNIVDNITNTIKTLAGAKVTVKLSDSSLLSEDLKIEVSGSDLIITNGSESETCKKVTSSEFSCSVPSN